MPFFQKLWFIYTFSFLGIYSTKKNPLILNSKDCVKSCGYREDIEEL